jgi:hypothetical protein
VKTLLLILGFGTIVMAGACTAPSQGALNAATAACSQGDRSACQQLPALNAEVQQENTNNQVLTGVAAAAGGALVGGVIGASTADPGCGNCGRGYYRGRGRYYHGRGWNHHRYGW